MITASLPIVFSLLAFVYGVKDKPVFSEEIKEIIQTVHDACVAKTGVAEEDITNCENGIFKEDTKLKCYMFCLLEEASINIEKLCDDIICNNTVIVHEVSDVYCIADEDGIVDYDMLVSLIPEDYSERTSRMIFSCKHLDTPDKDKCQRAFEVHKCSYEKDPDLYFLF